MFITVFCITMAVVVIAVFTKEAAKSAADKLKGKEHGYVKLKSLGDAKHRDDCGKGVGATIKGKRYSDNNEICNVFYIPDTGYYYAVLKNTKTDRTNVCSAETTEQLKTDMERTLKAMAEEENVG